MATGGIDLTIDKDGGVLKEIIQEGTGDRHPSKGDTVYVHYVGKLENGEQFDSSRDRNEPFSFTLGNGQVIKGWDVGVASMKKGEKAMVTCAAEYAYGKNGSPPKIPADATLKFEIELLSWQGEDISPERDGTITRSIIVEGEKFANPAEGSSVQACITGAYDGRVFYDKEVNFVVSEGSEANLPEGVDRAIRRFSKGEKSLIHLKGSRFTYGTNAPAEFNLPNNAELDFTIFLKEYEKVKASWELAGSEKIDAAESAKDRGTFFLKQGKLRLAGAKYLRVIELLEFEKPTNFENKQRRDAILLAGYLNSALVSAKQNETVECIKHCDKALELDSKNVKALYRKAMALQDQNDVDDAMKIYKYILELEPSNKAVAAQMVVCKQNQAKIREQEKKRFKGMFQKLADIEKHDGADSISNEASAPVETSQPSEEMVN